MSDAACERLTLSPMKNKCVSPDSRRSRVADRWWAGAVVGWTYRRRGAGAVALQTYSLVRTLSGDDPFSSGQVQLCVRIRCAMPFQPPSS